MVTIHYSILTIIIIGVLLYDVVIEEAHKPNWPAVNTK